MQNQKISLAGLGKNNIAKCLEKIDVPQEQLRMRTMQLWMAIYNKGITDFEKITTISKKLQKLLEQNFTLERQRVIEEWNSEDGTKKWLIRLEKQQRDLTQPEIETVFIPEKKRGTLCVSTQIGCTLSCSFCHTGTQKLVRNLTAQEIVGQLLIAKDRVNDWNCEKNRKITNIVFMGMGEPLLNFDNVKIAIDTIKDDGGLCFSLRRITLSTAGIVPMIKKCGLETGVMLAISLHATDNELRNKIMNINRRYPLEQLMQACREYPNLANSRRITFEYVMLHQINDSDAQARALLRLLRGIPAKINLIPFNSWQGCDYQCSTEERIKKFAQIINDGGYASPVRRPRGQDIMAACGQLKSLSKKCGAARQSIQKMETITANATT